MLLIATFWVKVVIIITAMYVIYRLSTMIKGDENDVNKNKD